jgi:hypothetical protein
MGEILRKASNNPGRTANDINLLIRAADECDRFYGGMMNWKANAQGKDRTIIELREKLAEVAPAGAQNATDRDLAYLIEYIPDEAVRNEAKRKLAAGAQNAEAIRNQAASEKFVGVGTLAVYEDKDATFGYAYDISTNMAGHKELQKLDGATLFVLQTGSANTQEGGEA